MAVKKFGYSTSGYFKNYFGGINAFTKEQFMTINGFSNLFFGWGGEGISTSSFIIQYSITFIIFKYKDDDAYIRSISKYKKVVKAPSDIARFYTQDHKAVKANAARFALRSIFFVKGKLVES